MDVRGKTVVLTGTFEEKRKALEGRLEALGATIGSGVTKKTDLLIAGADAGSKRSAAQALGVRTEDEAFLMRLLSGKAVDTPSSSAAPSAAPQGQYERLVAMVQALAAHKQVAISRWAQGAPASDKVIATAEKTLGAKLHPSIEHFYRKANGVCLVWFDRKGEIYSPAKAKKQTKFPPDIYDLQMQEPFDGGLFLPPLEKVLGPTPYLEYPGADDASRLSVYGETTTYKDLFARIRGFDYPGDFYHAGFLLDPGEGNPTVIVANDHGCFTDSYVTTFERYMECVLATYAHVERRFGHYNARSMRKKREAPPKGDGAKYFRAHAVALDDLLNTGE